MTVKRNYLNEIKKSEYYFQEYRNQFKKDKLILNNITDRYYSILDEYNFLVEEFEILSDQLKFVLKDYKISFLKYGMIFDIESCEEKIYYDRCYALIQDYETLLSQYEIYLNKI